MCYCGPTIYGDLLSIEHTSCDNDILFPLCNIGATRWRYVRNITDVGHLEHDADEAMTRCEKARLEQLEPMELRYYTNRYHDAMEALNVLPPSIEPRTTGHIIEQEELVKGNSCQQVVYMSNSGVYFDVVKYDRS